MKKFPSIFALALLCMGAAPALAQNGYVLDNFGIENGIRIETVKETASLPSSKKLVRPTSKSVTFNNGASERPTPLVYARAHAGMTASKSLDGFTTGDPKIDSFIVESGTRHGVDPVLIYSIMHQESSFKRGAISPKGARGLMQLMPGTAARFGVSNIFDPRQNIEGGTRYMRFLLDHFDGDVSLALAGYNAGEGAVLKYGRRVPPYRETQEYVRRIGRRYALMRDPETARTALRIKPTEVAVVRAETSTPLTTYERDVFAVRLPDGRLQLLSQ
ncbi:MAG: lytic transglycosylase domain-containing protein [Pyrinomonadaceae bacterium]